MAQAQKKRPGFPGRFFHCEIGLVPASAISTAVTTATITAATATAFAAATTATTTESATATATAFAGLHGTRFVHRQCTAIDFLAMELGDSRLCFVSRAHFDKAETTGTTGHTVIDHLNPRDVARLGKEIGQVVFRHAEGQIAHVQFYAHYFLLGWLADFFRNRIYAATEVKLT